MIYYLPFEVGALILLLVVDFDVVLFPFEPVSIMKVTNVMLDEEEEWDEHNKY
ncbi:MAG: hypothetical protein ACI8RD_011902 [Bacillariaceae sp.]|jgi:hypothetical protein